MNKQRAIYILFSIISISFFACKDENNSFLPEMTGKPGEVILVINNYLWESKSGKEIKEVLNEAVYGLPQEEAVFRAFRVTKSGFTNVIERHRNVLWLEMDSTAKASFTVKKDVWSKGQLVISISGKNDSVVAKIIEMNKANIIKYFSDIELERIIEAQKKIRDPLLEKNLSEKHGIEMILPKGFKTVLDTSGFIWMKSELQKSQGGEFHDILRNILIYTVPYTDGAQLEKEYLIYLRDSLSKAFVPGPVPGSYVKVYKEYPVLSTPIAHKKKFANQLKGLWNTEKYPMGGPFISYAYVDEARQRVVVADAFIYCPNFDKRELMREMEALLSSSEATKK
jgi:hypothetical protein